MDNAFLNKILTSKSTNISGGVIFEGAIPLYEGGDTGCAKKGGSGADNFTDVGHHGSIVERVVLQAQFFQKQTSPREISFVLQHVTETKNGPSPLRLRDLLTLSL